MASAGQDSSAAKYEVARDLKVQLPLGLVVR
jgi:hypothetical protein